MNILLINAHHAYPNWFEGSLNRAAVEAARNFFVSRGTPWRRRSSTRATTTRRRYASTSPFTR
ncbi:hypothetical protein ACUY2L_03935 [Corynebacterium mastitidis]